MFSRFSVRLRDLDIFCMIDLLTHCAEAFTPRPVVTLITKALAWRAYYKALANPLTNISEVRCLKFSQDTPGEGPVFIRTRVNMQKGITCSDSTDSWFKPLVVFPPSADFSFDGMHLSPQKFLDTSGLRKFVNTVLIEMVPTEYHSECNRSWDETLSLIEAPTASDACQQCLAFSKVMKRNASSQRDQQADAKRKAKQYSKAKAELTGHMKQAHSQQTSSTLSVLAPFLWVAEQKSQESQSDRDLDLVSKLNRWVAESQSRQLSGEEDASDSELESGLESLSEASNDEDEPGAAQGLSLVDGKEQSYDYDARRMRQCAELKKGDYAVFVFEEDDYLNRKKKSKAPMGTALFVHVGQVIQILDSGDIEVWWWHNTSGRFKKGQPNPTRDPGWRTKERKKGNSEAKIAYTTKAHKHWTPYTSTEGSSTLLFWDTKEKLLTVKGKILAAVWKDQILPRVKQQSEDDGNGVEYKAKALKLYDYLQRTNKGAEQSLTQRQNNG